MPTYDDSIPLADAIRIVFPDADLPGILKLLTAASPPLPPRVQLAVVLLSDGRFDQLRHYLRQAELDSRDVLYWAFAYGDEPPARLRGLLRKDPRV